MLIIPALIFNKDAYGVYTMKKTHIEYELYFTREGRLVGIVGDKNELSDRRIPVQHIYTSKTVYTEK